MPNGKFELYLPQPGKVAEIYRQLQKQHSAEPIPYWAKLWPSAIALATFLQNHPGYVSGKLVAEFAAGIGLPSLVSATVARKVWCTDLVADAVAVARKSAEWHGFANFESETCDWSQIPDHIQPEVVLLSDVNYEPGVFAPLRLVIGSFLEKGATIILATPQRLMAKPFIEKLLPYVVGQSVEEVLSADQPAIISIFVMRKS